MRKAAKPVSLRLDGDLVELIKADAKKKGLSINMLLEDLLRRFYALELCNGNEQAAKLYAEIKAGGDKKLIEILLNKKS
jgi:hypothetical protein